MSTPFASLKPLEPLMDTCVHCGFCLPACPSYLLLGKEMDSPRGRIYTMRAGLEDRVALGPAVVQHFDTCLGCMACETACPSGVKYAPLIEQTRAAIEQHHQRPFGERVFRRVLFSILPYPARLRLLAFPLALVNLVRRVPALTAVLPAKLANLVTLAPRVALATTRLETPEFTPSRGPSRLKVGLVTGCVQRAFFGDVNQATARVLSAEGCDVSAPRSQGCCGALALHAGEQEEARRFARELILTFEKKQVDVVAINAAGCGSALKEYGHLLKDDPDWAARARAFSARVRDVTEVLAGFDTLRAPRRHMALRVAYHDACHLAHAQGIRAEPRAVLATIPGLTVVPIMESEICCGSAGIFNLVQPEMAATLGQRKAGHIADATPDVVVTSNPGCILQIRAAAERAGHPYRVLHIVELLDAALSKDRSQLTPV
jgi:glycolate oxidase iron-sulfur subunit